MISLSSFIELAGVQRQRHASPTPSAASASMNDEECSSTISSSAGGDCLSPIRDNIDDDDDAELIVGFPSRRRRRTTTSTLTADEQQQVRQRQRPQPKKEKQRARFSNNVQVYTIKNLSTQYKHALWFTDAEIIHSKQRTVYLLQSLRRQNLTVSQYAEANNTETHNFMGLENHFSSVTCLRIMERRKRMANAVRVEQRRQDKLGVYDPASMTRVTEVISECSRQRSYVIGLIHTDNREEMGLVVP